MRRQTSMTRGARRPDRRQSRAVPWLALAVLATTACGPEEAALPPELQDPRQVQTAAGAVAFYRGVVASVPELVDATLVFVGVMTDELAALPLPIGGNSEYTPVDSRQDFSVGQPSSNRIYGSLHTLRAQAREARGFVDTYLSDADTAVSKAALGGHLYALEGYAELLLAELYCSGIPLTTVDFQGDYTLTAGFSTAEVAEHALSLFDSALARTADSMRLQAFAAMGRGRALLALGRYEDAAAAVAAVPDDYLYQVVPTHDVGLALRGFANDYTITAGTPSVADREGQTGLNYHSSGDPRTADTLLGPDKRGFSMYFPLKYYPPDVAPTLTLASGVEARLIEAEAALASGSGEWLTKLNALRQTIGLADTTDPGTPAARVDLLFRERAFWLYLTGHRQGDLRRLVRQYGRTPESVYPRGQYPGGAGQYGSEVVAPVPDAERRLNPKYTGCINRNA